MAGADVRGTVAEGYEPVRDAFVRNLTERGETGAAVAVQRDGRPVVDLWAGTTDPEHPHTAPEWAQDTVVMLRSATKGLTAAVPHLLHQRGQLDLDAPVGHYWPEFKAAGKERVLVRHLLSHRAGLPALDTPLTPEQASDGVTAPAALARQAPAWRPGTAHGYHPHTYGWLLAEVIRRATGRTAARFLAREIAEPLGLDLWLGLPDAARHRAARLVPAPAPEAARGGGLRIRPKRSLAEAYGDPESLTNRAFSAITPPPDENAPDYRAAGHPAAGGFATARSLARFYSALLGRLPDAPRLFTPATLTQARSQESYGPDRVLVVTTRFGLGYMLHGPASPMLSAGSFGHPGRGGSLAFADPESGTAFAYTTNGMRKSVTSDPRAQALVRAVRECL